VPLYRVGEVWYVDIQHDGRRTRRSTGTADRRQAQEYHDRLAAQLWREVKLGDAPARTFGAAVASWLEAGERDLSDRYRLRALLKPLQAKQLSSLTTAALEDAIGARPASTYNRMANLLQAVLHHAQGRGWLPVVPKIPRKPVADARTRWLTAEEWSRLQAALPLYLEQMARFTLATGLRENNVLRLRWDQVDMARRVAWIHPDEAKARKAIGVPLNDRAAEVLRERMGLHDVWVFAGELGEPYYKTSNRAWYAALRSAGLPGFRWHDLRHTWAAWHVMNGTRLEELKELGGWATLSLVQRYAHLSSEHLARVAGNVAPVSLRDARDDTEAA